jgi:type III secretion system FlhB-like substrate exporter
MTYTVALTGGIGSGKSTVADAFAHLGVNVIDADIIARQVVEPGTPGLNAITQRFGPQILNEDGTLNRRALREHIFAHTEDKRWLNALLHPQIQQETRRQMQRAAARRRMMDDVPKADVIVTNPTHYSVALRYDENKMSAPKVVAKGAGLIALRIREIGTENRVPILEAPPLARALYRHAEIGQQIPGQLYAAVAEVLAWVWQLKRWRLAGGQRPVKPENLPVPAALDFMNEKDTDG